MRHSFSPLLVTINDATRLVPVGRTKLYQLIKSGTVDTVKIGRRTFVKMSSLRALAGEDSQSQYREAEQQHP